MNGHVHIRRILVALDASGASLAALEAAAQLAEQMEAELLGLFVEDINLLRLAGLPFAREVGFPSARTRRLESEDMERALRAQAARAQQSLVQAAERVRVRWSFRVARGMVAAELLAAAESADLVALGMTGMQVSPRLRLGATALAVVSGATGAVLVVSQGACLRSPVVALYDGSPASVQALELAARLLPDEEQRISVLVVADDPQQARRLEAEAAACLKKNGVQARFRLLAEADGASLRRAIQSETPGTLVLAAGMTALRDETIQELLEAGDCAVLLVRQEGAKKTKSRGKRSRPQGSSD